MLTIKNDTFKLQRDFIHKLVEVRKYDPSGVGFDSVNKVQELHYVKDLGHFKLNILIAFKVHRLPPKITHKQDSLYDSTGASFARKFIAIHSDVDVIVFMFNLTSFAKRLMEKTYLDVQIVSDTMVTSLFYKHALQAHTLKTVPEIHGKRLSKLPVLRHDDPMCVLYGFCKNTCVQLDEELFRVA